jgi:hypothetical protein
MATRPWMKFYPADWQADQALRSVGLEARCLWIECMCIMHRAEPYGHLVVNGRPVTDTQLAVLAGASPDRVPALMAELATAGVSSRNRAGVIYSRRMTRDEKRSKDGATGKITGSKVPGSRRHQAIDETGEKVAILKVVAKVAEQPPCPQKPEAREKEGGSVDPPKKGRPAERELMREFERIWLLYPRRVDKQDAVKAWKKARQSAEYEEIEAGVNRYAALRQGEDHQYTKHFSRWLNAKAWLDESEISSEISHAKRPDRIDPAAKHADALDTLARAALDFDERESHRGPVEAAH